ncbi:hypothetical protein BJ546DRAFT_222045 [Cryomyces antarcticus]
MWEDELGPSTTRSITNQVTQSPGGCHPLYYQSHRRFTSIITPTERAFFPFASLGLWRSSEFMVIAPWSSHKRRRRDQNITSTNSERSLYTFQEERIYRLKPQEHDYIPSSTVNPVDLQRVLCTKRAKFQRYRRCDSCSVIESLRDSGQIASLHPKA